MKRKELSYKDVRRPFFVFKDILFEELREGLDNFYKVSLSNITT